jgi:putative dimethyl sulfoxide reductase chaperone
MMTTIPIDGNYSEQLPRRQIAHDMSAERLATLAGLYRFCSQSMRFPACQWLTHQYLDIFYQILDGVGGVEGKKALQTVFASGIAIEELEIEYTRLFINGAPYTAAPPYASVYLDRSLHGASTEKVLSYYIEKGFRMCSGADLPDHLFHQLEFLALLMERGDQQGERFFLTYFFLPWFSKFLCRILEEAEHPFYRTVVLLIDYFTKEEDEHGIHRFEA